MIARLQGELIEKTESTLIIDVAGVGYEVHVAPADFEAYHLGTRLTLHIYDHLRENAHELFGFSSLIAKRLFELLISVSGVGPKMGLAILGLGDVEVIRSAIASGDVAVVQRANGVGKRIAERVVVDLRDKVGPPGVVGIITPTGQTAHILGRDDALDALLALGYALPLANEALKNVDPTQDTQSRIKQALQNIR